MTIYLNKNIRLDVTLPIGPVRCFTSSALLVELAEIPEALGDGTVSAVTVTVVNADGMPVTAPAEKHGHLWTVLFAGTNFPTYGFTERGIRVHATISRGDNTAYQMVLGLGNLEIVKGDATAEPGDPMRAYVVKGSDVYFKSEVVAEVQHYVKQEMSYDPEIGWGADWTGDYILADGEFIPVESVPTPAPPVEEPNDAI